MGIVLNIPESALDYVLYGDNSSMVSDYLQTQLAALPVAFNHFTQRVKDAMVTSYNHINDTFTKYGILSSLQTQGVQAVDNHYQVLTTFQELQQANPTMQRWVMAHPEVRQLYVDQNLDGYSESYQNVFGDEVGEKDYNYRQVMSGSFVDLPNDEFKRVIYHDDLMSGDRAPDYYEKVVVRDTWHHIDNMLAETKFDFTCTSDAPMKINRG